MWVPITVSSVVLGAHTHILAGGGEASGDGAGPAVQPVLEQEERLVLQVCLSQTCRVAETPLLHLPGALRDGRLGAPSPPGLHC